LATLSKTIRAHAGGTPAAQDVAISQALQALAIVVPHYRTIALFEPGRAPLVATDPTEERSHVVPGLIAESRTLAVRTMNTQKPLRAGPVTILAGRSFYLFAAPAGDGGAVVATTDAAVMLETVSRRPTDTHKLVLLDPSGAAWIDCEKQARCQLLAADSAARAAVSDLLARGEGQGLTDAGRGAPLGLSSSQVIVGPVAHAESLLGRWSVVVVAPAATLAAQPRETFGQLILTSAGVAMAIVAVGIVMLKQHDRAAALRARLDAAEEVTRLQRQLIRAEKLATMGVLSAGIAHELGTPLTVVRVRAEHMLERARAARDVDDLTVVVGEIDYISSKISQVLDFSRDQSPVVRRTELQPAIDRAMALVEWRFAKQGVGISPALETDCPPLAAAADQFEQVLVNLLLNACDASARGSTVMLSARRDPDRRQNVRVEISDRGAGIAPHHLNSIFDPYFTTKERDEGAGLGLAIVGQIVRIHRADISVRSAVAEGTTVLMSWPAATATVTTAAPDADAPKAFAKTEPEPPRERMEVA
jgi:signal transduction histidine kinase